MKKRILSVIVSVFLVCITVFSVGCAKKNGGESDYKVTQKGTPLEYGSLDMSGLGSDTMPITGFIGPNDLYNLNGYKFPSTLTDDVYSKLRESGVNLIIESKYDLASLGKGTELESALKLGEKYGIYYIIKDTDMVNIDSGYVADSDTIAGRMETYKNYPSVAGIYLRDEPTATLYDNLKTAHENVTAANVKSGTKYSTYANLFPPLSGNILSGNSSESITYDEYLDGYCKTTPPFLMYDLYPFSGLDGAIAANWFNILNTYREKAEECNVPYWLWLQTGGKWPDNQSARIVTEAELLWSIGTALAMGAKGLGYFPLCMPPEYLTWGIESPYYAGLINQFGTSNEYQFIAAKAAKQIQAVDDVLMKSKSMGVVANGESPCTLRGSYVLENFRELKGVEGDPCVVGCFDYKGGTALYLVNNSTQKAGSFKLKFSDNYGYDIVRRGKASFKAGKSLDFTLEAGESVLITLR